MPQSMPLAAGDNVNTITLYLKNAGFLVFVTSGRQDLIESEVSEATHDVCALTQGFPGANARLAIQEQYLSHTTSPHGERTAGA